MLALKGQKLLIIAPHPDDEVIGCGGLIAKMKDAGGKVYVLFLTVGDTKDFSSNGFSSKRERIREIEAVSKYLNLDDYSIAFGGNSHHLRLDQEAQLELISAIERGSPLSIEKLQPTIVMFPLATNYNQDHRAAGQAAFAACRPASRQYKYQPQMVFSYEVAADQWNLEKLFTPNFFATLSTRQLKKKIAALKLYKSQLRQRANPRSPKALHSLATLRGAQSGSNLAEAFYCHRFLA
ncbi:PIG-L family deacetylase [Patescibacteria group bacterium]|nr:PIG-L family deacetylase [Patescibacteria group bacterium]